MSKRLLVIDDDAEVLRVYKAVLDELGEVRTATNLEQARQQLDGLDLILLDYRLKSEQLSFEQIVEELRPVAPILLCSGMPDPALRGLGERLGLAGYWNKGAGFVSLRDKVLTALSP